MRFYQRQYGMHYAEGSFIQWRATSGEHGDPLLLPDSLHRRAVYSRSFGLVLWPSDKACRDTDESAQVRGGSYSRRR